MIDLLVITSCINPPKQDYLKLTDGKQRLHQTLDSIIYFIDSGAFSKIVVCDGSDYDLNKEGIAVYAAENNVDLELIHFSQDYSCVIKFGKGYGEGEIMNYIVKNSRLYRKSKNFIKITGRLKILNINDIVNKIDNDKVYFNFFPSKKIGCVDTRFYMITTQVYETTLLNSYKKVNDSKRYSYEYCFTDDLRSNKIQINNFPKVPIFSGYSGTNNTKFTKDSYYYLEMVLTKIGLMNTIIGALSLSGLYVFNRISNILRKMAFK